MKGKLTPKQVRLAVAKFYGLPAAELAAPHRLTEPAATIRQMAVALAEELCGVPNREIAAEFGIGVSAVSHSKQYFATKITDATVAADVAKLRQFLQAAAPVKRLGLFARLWAAARNAHGERLQTKCSCGEKYFPRHQEGCPECRRKTSLYLNSRPSQAVPRYFACEPPQQWYGPDILTRDNGLPGFGSLQRLQEVLR